MNNIKLLNEARAYADRKIKEAIGAVNMDMTDIAQRGATGKIIVTGDSNTAGGYEANILTYISWLKWMLNVRDIENLAVIGYKTDNIVTQLPTILEKNPSYCIIMIGTNDLTVLGTTQTWATMKSNMYTILNTLIAANITPIICATIPRNTGAVPSTTIQWNRWLQYVCREYGIMFIDTYSPLLNSSGYADSQYYGSSGTDELHIIGSGHYLVANALKTALPQFIKPDYGYWVGEDQGCPNNLFLTDSNSDGTPDDWTISAQGGATATVSLEEHPTIGNYMRLERSAAGEESFISAYAAITSADQVVPGERFEVSLDIDVVSLTGDAGVRVFCQTFTADYGQSLGDVWITPNQLPIRAVGAKVRLNEGFTIPANTSIIRLTLNLCGSGSAVVRFGNIVARKV